MLHRYGSVKEREQNGIPAGIFLVIRRNGEKEPWSRIIDGKYRIRYTDSAVEIIDTAGAGVVESHPLGMVRYLRAEDVGYRDETS